MMDTLLIALAVGYETTAFATHVTSPDPGSKWRFMRWARRVELPLITEVLMSRGRPTRWLFVLALGGVMVDHLSLVDIPGL